MSNLAQFFGLNYPIGAAVMFGFYGPGGLTTTGLLQGEITVNGQTWVSLARYRELSKTNYPDLWNVLGDGYGLATKAGTTNLDAGVCLLANSGTAVCVGASSISRSTNNGTSWVASTEPAWTFAWGGVANGIFMAGGNLAEQLSTSTDDGVTFTSRTFTGGPIVKDCAYGASTYVVVGTSGSTGNIAHSTNATTWTVLAEATNYQSVAFGNGVFVAVGNSNAIKSSTNGSTWTTRTSAANAGSNLTFVFYLNGKFVADGGLYNDTSFTQQFQTSTDGTTWTMESATLGTPSFSSFTKKPLAILPSGAVYYPRQHNDYITSDGMTWAMSPIPSSANTGQVACATTTHLLVKRGSTNNDVWVYPRKTDTVCLWPTRTAQNILGGTSATFETRLNDVWVRVK